MDHIPTHDSGRGHDGLREQLSTTPGFTRQQTRLGQTFLVTLAGVDDPLSPQNWPFRKKLVTSIMYACFCVCSTISSAILSPASPLIARHFNISEEVATLSTSTLFLLGYVAGPFVWAPLSENRGRKMPMIISLFGFICFGAGSATAKDYQTLCLTRFFQGAMGACPVSITTAAFADMYSIYHRAIATAIFGLTVFSGPMLASPLGGFTADNGSLGWRWCVWWTVFSGAATLCAMIPFASESYLPHLLKEKAVKLRAQTGEWAIHAKLEEKHQSLPQKLRSIFLRPIQMLIQEPILMLISLYTAFVYAILYTFLVAYTIVFVEEYGMDRGVGGLPFIGLMIGLLLAASANIVRQRYIIRLIRKNSGILIPEWRMPMAISGSIAFPVGLFWFGWTAAYPQSIHWIVPTASGIVTGYGILMIFMNCFTYLIDVYKTNSASAFAANTIIRSGLAASFPLFATQMFHNLGVQWATTLLACLAVLLAPVPALFYIYGARIRAMSRFALDDGAVPDSNQKDVSKDEEDEHQDLKIRSSDHATQADRNLEKVLSGENNWIGTTTSNVREEDPERLNGQMLSREQSKERHTRGTASSSSTVAGIITAKETV